MHSQWFLMWQKKALSASHCLSPFYSFFVCQNNDELFVHYFRLAHVNAAISCIHVLFKTCRLCVHPNKSFLIAVYYTTSPCKFKEVLSETFHCSAQKRQIRNANALSPCKMDDVTDRQYSTGRVNVFNYNKLLLKVK